jgi:hypothetical protein
MSGKVLYSRTLLVLLVAAGLSCTPVCQVADGTGIGPDAASELYIKMQLSSAPKFARLKPGDVVDGSLSRDVYSGNQKVLAAGSAIRLTVDHLEKRKRPANDHWPWIVQAFTPRRISYPVFKSATVVTEQGVYPLNVSLVSSSRMREVRAEKGKHNLASEGEMATTRTVNKHPQFTMILQAENTAALAPAKSPIGREIVESDAELREPIPAGTHCRVLLLTGVSASKSRVGDDVAARLLDPLFLNSKLVLPAGTMFRGKVSQQSLPRRLSRAGSLRLIFTELTLPQGIPMLITASLAGAELDEKSHTRMDSEGQLHGEHPGKAWMAINLGTSAGIAKGVDDGAQLLIEALISTATDVSTAGTTRIVSSCVSGVYMATRHGRDVILPRFTEMEVSIDRPVLISPTVQKQVAALFSTTIK